MNRRNFLKTGSLAGLSLTALSIPTLGLSSTSANTNVEKINGIFSIEEATIDGIRKRFESGELNSNALTQMYLDRIQELDKNGPKLNSVIETNPDALSIASSLDRERKNGRVRGPLHGIPILIKGNIDTTDKMQTTAGSLALAGNIANKDAFVVEKLREAGAVLLGKTNLSEWANFRSTRSVSGWSSQGGQTKNPYVLDRTPCGSSSGSGVAVSSNLCTVAIGTETDGSISCPASMNGIVGIKPTVGLVSRSGIIPISKSQDTAGPMARTVTDAAITLGAITGMDPADSSTEASIGKSKADYTPYLDINGLKGKRIGIEKSLLKHHEGIDPLLGKALQQIKNNGATLMEVEFMKVYDELSKDEFEMMEYEFKDGLNKYLSTANSKMKSLADIINFDKEHASAAMPFFQQEVFKSAQAKGDLNSPEYKNLVHKLSAVRNTIDKVMQENQLDALCGPATGAPWCIDMVNGDFWTGYGAYGPAAVAGYPSITVPMGNLMGLPIGISFFSRAFEEPALISIAYSYEQISKNRFEPTFKKTLIEK